MGKQLMEDVSGLVCGSPHKNSHFPMNEITQCKTKARDIRLVALFEGGKQERNFSLLP